MKRTIATAIAAAAYLLSTMVHAETLHQGKVYRTTADRIIVEQRLPCTYGRWESRTLPSGATVLTRHKVCSRSEVRP